jgi:hypothetical protein
LTEVVITAQADVSAINGQTANNETFYEHSINYPIPATSTLGNYNVSNWFRISGTGKAGTYFN